MRTLLPLLLALPAAGCVFAYGPNAPAPGLSVPATEKGTGDVSVSAGAARNVADSVEVDLDGRLEHDPDRLSPWPYVDLSWRQGIADGIGFEARINGSLVLPVPIPVPNGLSLAPMIELAELGDEGRLVVSPRGVLTHGEFVAAGPTVETRTSWNGYGLEAPFMFVWEPHDAVALNATPYARVFWVVGQAERQDDDDPNQVGDKRGWPTWGGGLTANGHLTLGFFRLGIGGDLEAVPDPVPNHPCPECEEGEREAISLHPQLALSLGVAW